MEPTCVSAEVHPSTDKDGWYEQAKAVMKMSDGTEKVIPFYDDEISFRPDELVGLTRQQADELYCSKQEHALH